MLSVLHDHGLYSEEALGSKREKPLGERLPRAFQSSRV